MSSDSQAHFGKPRASVFFRPKPDGSIDPAGEAGWFLQRERERRCERLEDAGRACRVHPHHLEAIEAGDLTRLPERRETLRMIGVYAQSLGFDPHPLMQHYVQFLPGPAGTAQRPSRAARPFGSAEIIAFPIVGRLLEAAKGSGGIVATFCGATLLFAVASYVLMPSGEPGAGQVAAGQAGKPSAAKQVRAEGPSTEVSSITSLTEEVMNGDTAEIREADAGKAGPPLPEPEIPGAAAGSPEAADNGGFSGMAELIARETGADPGRDLRLQRSASLAEQQPAGPGHVYGAENVDSRLVLHAKGNVWIRIEDAKGNVVVAQTLLAGDSYRVPSREGLTVIARDGGLLTYSIDGVSKGQLGNPGEILVGRPLDLRRLTEG